MGKENKCPECGYADVHSENCSQSMKIPTWLTEVECKADDEICTSCYKDMRNGESCYENSNGVLWCKDCAKNEE